MAADKKEKRKVRPAGDEKEIALTHIRPKPTL